VLEALPADGTPVPLGRLGASARPAVRALADLGLVEILEKRPRHVPEDGPAAVASEPPHRPTPGQAEVLRLLEPAVRAGRYAPFLLYGATGSGKTEVYLRTAEAALREGRGVLYLVPEIGLTPLLVGRLRGRFPGAVAVLHSGLSARERHDTWWRVREGGLRFVVGTRSAVFSPVADVGLVIVDEEQDGSYKQEETPRYNGRDLAVVRAKRSGAVLLMGSATPSLESFHHARSGRYTLLRLGGRVGKRPLPKVRIVDMRREFLDIGEVQPLSRALVESLRACHARGEQALVLRNRRGWAVAVFCPACGERVSCPRCSIALTWHRAQARLRCHYCDFETRRPAECPRCDAETLRLLGEGAERIEDEIRAAVPEARVVRMDRDTVSRKGAHEALLRRFDRGEIDVLVGTQMIAKGHDFPNVTLVGVVSADQSLGLPDFRAAERTFQLLTQVSGRAGRGERPGEVVVQAFDPSHPVLREAADQDFEAFYDREIRYRRALRYPPLTALVELLIADRDELRAREWAEALAGALRQESEGRLLLSGPGPAPIERLRGLHRQQILVRTAGRRRLVQAVDRALGRLGKTVPRRAVHVDVDPLTLL
jgi:primosomal protein N' (replication factor Y)